MSRLQQAFRRLYQRPETASGDALIDAHGHVRAAVLELGRPADWERLGQVWRGVQTELGLPAPGIAASGTDALQLWFSLAEPLSVDSAHAFVDALRRRWLVDLPAGRVTLWPQPASAVDVARHLRPVPVLNEATGNWSAFVAPDLAPLFADTPWLDIPPGDEAQAGVLGALASIQPGVLATATTLLTQALQAASAPTASAMTAPAPEASPAGMSSTAGTALAAATAHLGHTAHTEPRSFLLAVMNDGSVPLPLRIEAARALLGTG
ncbi:hypothetical protein [Sphaerotilus mobilis]|uniref:Uncharacterized protein n=1 Tax=Sphaerotilus mobilis TaxID=47994 RepID=A0A4Q7LGM9_9BURK|nr:hypothetical protein [Sphaerotilus mobilis]RZS53384.1 hypothetical protein EV685_3012 [Sphaerotilus mobilis]